MEMSGKDENTRQYYFSAAEIAAMPERRHRHQFNENAVRMTRTLGDPAGLKDMGLHIVRLEPGRESTEFHFHGQDEEFLMILSGRGIAEIGDDRIEVGPGDVMAFPKNSPAHVMHVPEGAGEDLVYLMGGTRAPVDICTYPRAGLRMTRADGVKEVARLDDLRKV